jgi:hypothetical protein
LNVYAFKQRIVKERSEIGAGWTSVRKVLKEKAFEFFVCHLFDWFREAEKEIEFVEAGVTHRL